MTDLTDPAFQGGLRVGVDAGERTTRVIVSGDADFSVVPDLQEALDRVSVGSALEVVLDLSELVFADADVVRRLVAFARRVRGSGREVRTTGAGAVVRRVAVVLGCADELRLV